MLLRLFALLTYVVYLPIQHLILVNGKRRHRASVIAFQGGGVNDGAQGPDISVIPSVALKQVEVLT